MVRKTVTRKVPSSVWQKETHKLLGTTVPTRTRKSWQDLTLLEAGKKVAGSLYIVIPPFRHNLPYLLQK